LPSYFADTSALAKLYHSEPGSLRMEELAQLPGNRLIISQLTLVEIQSVFAIKTRTGVITPSELSDIRSLFYADLADRRFDVARLSPNHLEQAEALVRAHAADRGLRALDAIQLAVALDLHARAAVNVIVASDKNLCAVARMEGLAVLDPTTP
jgi:predicted nucleic acid-binding protein